MILRVLVGNRETLTFSSLIFSKTQQRDERKDQYNVIWLPINIVVTSESGETQHVFDSK